MQIITGLSPSLISWNSEWFFHHTTQEDPQSSPSQIPKESFSQSKKIIPLPPRLKAYFLIFCARIFLYSRSLWVGKFIQEKLHSRNRQTCQSIAVHITISNWINHVQDQQLFPCCKCSSLYFVCGPPASGKGQPWSSFCGLVSKVPTSPERTKICLLAKCSLSPDKEMKYFS